MTDAMKIKSIAPWFGGKRTLAPEIIAELGEHSAYWELFCGSMAVLFAKEPATMETVNDLHGDLINLARVVQDDNLSAKLFGRLYRTACSEPQHRIAAERHRERGNIPATEAPDVDRAADYFLCSWLGRNGVAGTSSYNQGFCRRFTKNGGHAAKRFASAVESIPEWWDRLRHVTLLNDNAFDLVDRIEDSDGVAIYIDAPYLTKGAKYVHDFAPEDHDRLAASLCRFKRTRVVVSYYAEPKVLQPGETFVAALLAEYEQLKKDYDFLAEPAFDGELIRYTELLNTHGIDSAEVKQFEAEHPDDTELGRLCAMAKMLKRALMGRKKAS